MHAPGRTRALLAAVGLVLLFVLVQSVAFTVLAEVGQRVATVEGLVDVRTALQLGAVQLAGITFGLLLVVFGASSWRGVGLRAERGAARAGWWALLPVGLLVVGPSLALAIAEGDRLVAARVGAAEAAAFLALALLISVNEELWFRGLVQGRLGEALRPVWTILLSALLFGLPHYAGTSATLLNAIAVSLAVGVPFAAVRLRYRSLWPLVAWHTIIDAWAFLHTSSVVAQGDPDPAEMAVALVLPSLLALAYLGWGSRSSRAPARLA